MQEKYWSTLEFAEAEAGRQLERQIFVLGLKKLFGGDNAATISSLGPCQSFSYALQHAGGLHSVRRCCAVMNSRSWGHHRHRRKKDASLPTDFKNTLTSKFTIHPLHPTSLFSTGNSINDSTTFPTNHGRYTTAVHSTSLCSAATT